MTGSSPKISIALCTFNGAAYLPKQLDSLLAQDHANLELVACDDASTDACWSILQAYAPRFAHSRLMRNPRTLGLLANFEQAFRACSGDWLAPCDQDDIWRPDKLSRLLAAADAQTSLVYGDSLLIDVHGQAIDDARGGKLVSGRYRMISGSDPRMFALSNCISGHAALVRRQVLDRALPLPDGVSYDAWIAFVAANVGTIRYVDEPLVEFRQHERNASGFAGQLKQAPRSERDKREAERRHIEALASFAGSQQAFFKRLLGLWEQRTAKSFTPALALFLYRHREAVFAMKTSRPGAKGRHALKYLRGAKLADRPEL